MSFKSAIRWLLLLPVWPRAFLAVVWLFRLFRFLPRRIQGERPPRRILIVNITGNLGDALMMLPLVDNLHAALPLAAIDLLVEAPIDAPLRAIPWVRQVFCFQRDARKIPVLGYYLRIARMIQYARRTLRAQPYDLALLPRWGTDPSLSSYLAALSTAPIRCGHDPGEERSAEPILPGMAALLTIVSHGGEGLAEAVREQLLLPACGLKTDFDAAAEERRPVQSVLAMARGVDVVACASRLGVSIQRPFLLLAPGASHRVRCWPTERFALLGTELHRQTGLDVYTIGGPADQALGKQIETLSAGLIRSLIGKTTIIEAIALTGRAALLVTNDSGPAHAGGSLGTPTLVLSACPLTCAREHGNSPLRVRPVGPCVHTLQPEQATPDCGDRCVASQAHCILGIDVDMAIEHALRLLTVPPTQSGLAGPSVST